MLSPTPDCTCPVKCSCDLIKTFQKKQEIKQVICFLKGLAEVYGTVKSNILMMEPLPTINKAYGIVLQQEGQLQGSTISDSKFLVNTTTRQSNQGTWRQNNAQVRGSASYGRGRGNPNYGSEEGRGRGNNYNSKLCTFCHKLGHTIDECYSKHGFPPGYRPRNNSTINNLAFTNTDLTHTNLISTSSQGNNSQPPQLAHEQLTQLINALQQHTVSSHHSVGQIQTNTNGESSTKPPLYQGNTNIHFSDWILDSGATDHVTHDFFYLLFY